MAPGDSQNPIRQLQQQGVVLLRGHFPPDALAGLAQAAARCFASIAAGREPPAHHRFNRFSHSILIAALADFGCPAEALAAPLSAPALDPLFTAALGGPWTCRMDQSWARRKFCPAQVPDARYHPQDWHQDGALGVLFPAQPGPPVPMTPLLTCWIPLTPCGIDSPALEFIRRPQDTLLHFTQLADPDLRRRFPPEDFWAPALESGDALVFLNGALHRTYATPAMQSNRLSIEYRIFPR